MRRKEFLENVAVPLLGIAVVMFIVYLFCVENGVCDYPEIVDSFRDSLWHTKNVFLDDSKRV